MRVILINNNARERSGRVLDSRPRGSGFERHCVVIGCLDLPEKPELLERTPKYRKDQSTYSWNPGRFAPDPVRPLDVSPQRCFAPGRFAPGRFAPLVVSPLVNSPQEEKSTYFVETYVNS